MATTITLGTAVICRDDAGNTVQGIVTDVMEGAAAGGGIAVVKGVWPGNKRPSDRWVELAYVEAVA